jgi:large conductance mechanosensitive channel
MVKGFRDFILRGNVVDLAVGIVIGVAFGAVVTALVTDFITPVIGAIGGKPDFSGLYFTINGSKFLYGAFINSIPVGASRCAFCTADVTAPGEPDRAAVE